MAKQTPILVKSCTGDTALLANTVVVASTVNPSSNVQLPAAAGARFIVGVTQQNSDNQFVAATLVQGIVQCRFLTGTAIVIGDIIKIADIFGRVTKAVPAAPGAAVRGQVGIAFSVKAAGDATDTLVDVLLEIGVVLE